MIYTSRQTDASMLLAVRAWLRIVSIQALFNAVHLPFALEERYLGEGRMDGGMEGWRDGGMEGVKEGRKEIRKRGRGGGDIKRV